MRTSSHRDWTSHLVLSYRHAHVDYIATPVPPLNSVPSRSLEASGCHIQLIPVSRSREVDYGRRDQDVPSSQGRSCNSITKAIFKTSMDAAAASRCSSIKLGCAVDANAASLPRSDQSEGFSSNSPCPPTQILLLRSRIYSITCTLHVSRSFITYRIMLADTTEQLHRGILRYCSLECVLSIANSSWPSSRVLSPQFSSSTKSS